MMTLVEPLIPSLRRYARSLLRDPAAADDLVQDCLERVISRWHQRREGGDARTWVFTILHNLAMNQLKRTSRRGIHVEIDEAGESAFATPAPQEDHMQLHHVLKILTALPEEQRTVLLLVSVEDLSYSETAEVLGVPLGTVMSRLSRGRHRLATLIENSGAGPTRQLASLRSIK